MKRKFKRIASLVLAAVMVFAMAMPAMAASADPTTYSITINDTDTGHKYTAYQIFTGTLSGGTNIVSGNPEGQVLSDVSWGDGIEEAGKTALYTNYYPAGLGKLDDKDNIYKLLKAVQDANDAAALAKILGAEGMLKKPGKEFEGTGPYTLEGLAAGYYMVVDETEGATLGEGDVYSKYIVQVVGNTTMNPKKDKPSSEKKVKDINDSNGDGETGWQDSADYDIDDDVPFQLKGVLPKDYKEYKSYYLKFNDEESKGLILQEDTITVYVDKNGDGKFDAGTDVEIPKWDEAEQPNGYKLRKTPASADAGEKFSIEIENLMEWLAGDAFAFTEEGPKMQVVVEYKSKLTGDDVVFGAGGNPNTLTMEYSNNPNVGGGGDHGTTPPDKVIVFTYQTTVDKIDGEYKPLEGAEFTLYKKDPTNPKAYKDKEAAEAAGLDESFVGYVELSKMDEITVDGKKTEFSYKGLDDGEYILVESKTPTGHNTADPVHFTVTATHTDGDNPELQELNVNPESGFTGSAAGGDITRAGGTRDPKTVESGTVFGEVINQSGTTLPETGGIGTTIFYVVGSVLVLGAVILLVTKRRMKSE